MSFVQSLSRYARPAAIVAAVALLVIAPIQLGDEQSAENTTQGIEHLALAAFSISWLALVPVVLELGRRGASRVALVPVAGQVLLGVLGTISNVRGEDPSFFAAVAVPSNLAIFGGWIALAVILRRRRAIPMWFAVALPVAFIGMIPAAMVGGGFVSAAIWLGYAQSVRATDGHPLVTREVATGLSTAE